MMLSNEYVHILDIYIYLIFVYIFILKSIFSKCHIIASERSNQYAMMSPMQPARETRAPRELNSMTMISNQKLSNSSKTVSLWRYRARLRHMIR